MCDYAIHHYPSLVVRGVDAREDIIQRGPIVHGIGLPLVGGAQLCSGPQPREEILMSARAFFCSILPVVVAALALAGSLQDLGGKIAPMMVTAEIFKKGLEFSET